MPWLDRPTLRLDAAGRAGRGNMGGSRTEVLFEQRDEARDKLASALGLPNLRRVRSGAGSLALY
jgi:hypothetical protein